MQDEQQSSGFLKAQTRVVYVVASGPREADYLANEGIGCETREESMLVLLDILSENDAHPIRYKVYKRKERVD